MRVATKIVGAQDAEDVVQNAYLSALKTTHPFCGRSAAFTWFCRVVINHCFMHLRKSQRAHEETVEEMPDAHAREIPADVLIYHEQKRGIILRAIDSLTPERKAAVLAQFQNPDLTVAQLAQMSGKSVVAVKSNIHGGRKALAEILKSEAA